MAAGTLLIQIVYNGRNFIPSLMITSKSILIIGATGGIGRVLSKVFKEAGASLTISARTEDKLMALREELGNADVFTAPGDASKPEDVERIFRSAIDTYGKVDCVIIAAGTWKQLSIDNSTQEALDLADSHFKALFLPSLVTGFVAQRIFREQGHGLIVNTSSHAAIRPELQGNLTYGPMKAASRHFMLALRHELSGTKVRVTDIEPAIVNTPDTAALLDTQEKRSKAVQPEAIAQWIIDHLDDADIPPTALFDSEITI